MSTQQDPLSLFVEGIWLSSEPIRILGMPLSATMTLVRLNDGGLLVYSPISLTPRRQAAVEALGRITHLYAPNLYHHLYLGAWADAFPGARVHAPLALAKKRPEIRIDRIHASTPEPAFTGLIDECPIEGFRLAETVLYHRPSRTLLVADLVHNVGRPAHPWSKLYTRLMGFYDQVALSRIIRWTAFTDRTAARHSIDTCLRWPIDRLIVGHGTPLTADANEAITRAFHWLRARK